MDIRMLTPGEIDLLAFWMTEAGALDREVRVSWDNGLKVKIGGGMWSAPMGK